MNDSCNHLSNLEELYYYLQLVELIAADEAWLTLAEYIEVILLDALKIPQS